MRDLNIIERVKLYLRSNPALTYEDICVLLLIESMYKDPPKDIEDFRHNYAHLDPKSILSKDDKISFIRISRSKNPTSVIKHMLNSYIDIKFNDIEHLKSYEENMKIFKNYSILSSKIIENILKTGDFPEEVVDILSEQPEVKECYDMYDLMNLYKRTRNHRTRYEVLRKLGLIIIFARIKKTFDIEGLEQVTNGVWRVFGKGLNVNHNNKKAVYFWLDEDNKVIYSVNKAKTEKLYQTHKIKRMKLAEKVYPVQTFSYHPFKTPNGNNILHIEIRNKFKKNGTIDSTSAIEKMIRKNIQFPNQIHDVIGIKIVVGSEDEFKNIIEELETFLGGSSTRKKEKNSYHKFGKKRLNEFSAKEYYVWKAVYDIALEHHSIPHIDKMLEITKGNKKAQEELLKRRKYYLDHPKDFIVEVQLQDLESYLQSIAKGSPSAHDVLKKHQVRRNSFYKLFPKEIYKKELLKLKITVLNNTLQY